jgi:beta-barrel assembly-enhancing protease
MKRYPAAFYGPGAISAQPASVTVTEDLIVIDLDGLAAEPLRWPRVSLKFEEGAVVGGPLRITSGAGEGLLMASDADLLSALGRRSRSGSSALAKGLLIFAAITLGLLLAFYFLLLPWIAGVLARHVPASIEQQLGRMALDQLAPPTQRCEDEAVRKPVRAIVDKLAKHAPKMDYPFQVYIVKDKTINALATPGGFVVVYTGLLQKTKTPEALAAVLAHEMTHVTGRHGMVGVMRGMTFWAMLSYLVGDATGIVVQAAAALSQLSYQRGQEEEADRGAMLLFESARIDPRGLEESFAMLSKETPDVPAAAKYFSTHPSTEDRLAEIRKWAKTMSYRPEPLLANTAAVWPPRGACME